MTYISNGSIESLEDSTDASLVQRARLGDGAAFELIVRRHNQALFRAAKGVLNDDDIAQDAIQEAYLKAFTKIDSFQERSSLKTWLTRIVINQAITIQRRQHQTVSLDENVEFLHGNQPAASSMTTTIDGRQTPEIAANQQELKHILEAAIGRLPDIYRCVVMLRDVEGLSASESAYCLGINETLVKKRLSRARDMLRQDLLQRIETQTPDIFEFAGKHCDAVTDHVMTELHQRGMIKRS